MRITICVLNRVEFVVIAVIDVAPRRISQSVERSFSPELRRGGNYPDTGEAAGRFTGSVIDFVMAASGHVQKVTTSQRLGRVLEVTLASAKVANGAPTKVQIL